DPTIPADILALLDKYSCTSCHAISRRLVGPMWTDVAAKGYSAKRIMQLVKVPEPGNWPGYSPMAAQPTVPKADLQKIANWLVAMKS
ncbi:MAG: cytochrome C, partial [Saprospiraceae bacterium]